MPKFPARVHPILARKADTAVIIRRGPSKSVCAMLWDRRLDFNDMKFEAIAAPY